ncbi:MAG: bifunctional cytochrome P450/NADPH--P450 reductase CypB [Microscillaceae bacterium]
MEASILANAPQPVIPCPPRWPYLGNLPQLSAHNPTQHFMGLMDKYSDGALLQIHTPFGNVIVAATYEYARELCDETRFQKNLTKPLLELRDLGGDGLFTSWTSEPNWQKAHNILAPGLGQRAIKGYFPMMLDIAERLLAKWHNIPPDQFFNLTDDMTRLTFDTIGLCGFDYRFHSFASDKPHPFIEAMVNGLEDSMNRMHLLEVQKKLRFKKKRRYQQSLQYMFKVVDDIIAERKQHPEKYQHNTDFMSLMLNATDLASGEKLDDANIRYQIITFLIAGHETTSGLLSFAFYYLMTHPEVMQKAYEEVDTVLGGDWSQKPSYKDVMDLKYIQQILFESLRLWPTAPAFSVFAAQDTVLGGKYPVKKRQPFIILLPKLHRDAAIWGPHPEAFDPERFAPGRAEQIPPEAYKPFGNGQRACIGRQFALLEATLVMGLILQRYRLHLKPGYVFKIKETLTLKPDDLQVRIVPRPLNERPAPRAKTLSKTPTEDVAKTTQALPFWVAYGSNMGASEEFAGLIAQKAQRMGFAVQLTALDDLVEDFPKTGILVIVSATYNGQPPHNARRFAEWLAQATNCPAGLQYAVFGCGNTQWQTFQAFPRFIDQRLSALGSARLQMAGEADAARSGFEDAFEAWEKQLWQTLSSQYALDNTVATLPRYTLQLLAPETPTPLQYPSRRYATHWLTVKRNEELQLPGSGRSTRHLELALPKGLTYQTGDHLGLIPQNPEELVARVCRRFGRQASDVIQLDHDSSLPSLLPSGQPISLGNVLGHFVELQSPLSVRQLDELLRHTVCPPEKDRLEAIKADFENNLALRSLSVLDVLEEVPACEISLAEFLAMLPALQPRYFSISSSALVQPEEAHLTVGVLEEAAHSGKGIFKGVCTNYLRQVQPGQAVQAFVERTESPFRLPTDASRPLILIGAGTGLAPLRAFLQERQHQHRTLPSIGKVLLFFGCRHPEQDFIYQEELEALVSEGWLEIIPAFSRLNAEKAYVQHKIWDNRDLVWKMMQENARVYVCGDAKGMAPAVRGVLMQLYQDKNKSTLLAAQDWWCQYQASGNYLEDVWA